MRLGFIGLGKMGKHMVLRLVKAGHDIVGYNQTPEPIQEIIAAGAQGVDSLQQLVTALPTPRYLWLMIPQAAVDDVISQLLPLLSQSDVIIDGGNSNFRKTMARSATLATKGIQLVDMGVSGGLAASRVGYCIMMGGPKEIYQQLEPALKTLCVPGGYLHVGPVGSGHYVKMIHNAIEYGMMQAIGEGFELLEHGPFKGLAYQKIAHLWNHGSIIRGFLMEMTESAFAKDSKLTGITGHIDDTGEGKWAIEEALAAQVSFTVNTVALYERYRSRKENPLSNRVVAALRQEFGGHGVKKV